MHFSCFSSRFSCKRSHSAKFVLQRLPQTGRENAGSDNHTVPTFILHFAMYFFKRLWLRARTVPPLPILQQCSGETLLTVRAKHSMQNGGDSRRLSHQPTSISHPFNKQGLPQLSAFQLASIGGSAVFLCSIYSWENNATLLQTEELCWNNCRTVFTNFWLLGCTGMAARLL